MKAQALLANDPLRHLHEIERQRENVDHEVAVCALDGVTRQQIIEAALEAKMTVEQEWRVRLPSATERLE